MTTASREREGKGGLAFVWLPVAWHKRDVTLIAFRAVETRPKTGGGGGGGGGGGVFPVGFVRIHFPSRPFRKPCCPLHPTNMR
ncbi:hypothetical protein ZHAS_00003188 [Anopheles sinensis]|uniref:Uncharacterized protein n=1 Tax=Anopheles sinensis TaxID=74873 RepID=A0A084VDT4_ANOSI|nr:hypothetical protein ZHAS_00003188 [Anopheles sinensis]